MPATSAALARIPGTRSVGELMVLSASACEEAAAAVVALEASWTPRAPHRSFFTLGANAYMDLAPASGPAGGDVTAAAYDAAAGTTNRLLRDHFERVYTALSAALSGALDMPCRYADDLALPGFHIWTAAGIPRRDSASVHFDLQYQRLLGRPGYARATGTVSFTLPVRLPAAGSSLRIWPDVTYPEHAGLGAAARGREPLTVQYRVGHALVHSGHVLHQIGFTQDVKPDDVRITLQGHGLVVDGELVCYW